MPDDWRTEYDKYVCRGCRHTFRRHPDCLRCEKDRFTENHTNNILNIGPPAFSPALHHPIRTLIVAALRKEAQS